MRRFTKEEKPIILKHYQSKSNIQISRIIDRTPKQIKNYLYRNGLKRNKYPMNDEWRHNISIALKGYQKSEEHKMKLSLKTKEQFKNGMPEETKRKLSLANSGKNHPFYGKKHSAETRRKLSLMKIGKPNPKHSEKLKELYAQGKIKPPLKGKHHSEETKKKIGLKSKSYGFFKRKNRDAEFNRKRLRGLLKRPTNPEKQMMSLLDKNFPEEWKYVGNGQVLIDNLNPDFINNKGKKLIIEVFGDYWHDPNRNWVISKQERQARFNKYGFKMLVIKESELDDEEKIINRVSCFESV